jgi:6-phosphogluconate dehydrogenase
MQVGMIGLGRMGGSMVRRLLRGGHTCVVFDLQPAAMAPLANQGATATNSLDEFVRTLETPRVVWLMVPAAVVDTTVLELSPHLQSGDIIVDGGNSHFVDDIRRAGALEANGVHYLDVGVSGGVWGTDRGYCLMIGGRDAAVARLDPIFKTLAPGVQAASRTPGRDTRNSTAEQGYLHCGPPGAGHFVKMVHNGIEYALMAAYAEGFNILAHANVGARARPVDAETAPITINTSSPCPTSPKCGAAEASSVHGCSISQRGPWPSTRTCSSIPAECPIPAKAAGPPTPRSRVPPRRLS